VGYNGRQRRVINKTLIATYILLVSVLCQMVHYIFNTRRLLDSEWSEKHSGFYFYNKRYDDVFQCIYAGIFSMITVTLKRHF